MTVSTDLVSFWEMNEASGNAPDEEGSNNLADNNTVGSDTGNTYATARDLERDNSEFFSISSNSDFDLSTTSYTWMFWLKPESFPGSMYILNKSLLGAQSSADYRLQTVGTGTTLSYYIGDGTNQEKIDVGTLATGEWSLSIFGYDSTSDEMFASFNGSSLQTVSPSFSRRNQNIQINFGALIPSFTSGFDGLMGPVALWHKSLSNSEIKWLYNLGKGRTYTEVVNYTPLDVEQNFYNVNRHLILGN